MSNPWCFGAIWPDDGQDAIDIAQAIYDARYAGPGPFNSPFSHEQLSRSSLEPEGTARDGEAWMWSPLTHENPSLIWRISGWEAGTDRFFARRSAPSAQASREETETAQRSRGEQPAWSMDYDYFPFSVELYVNWDHQIPSADWDLHQEYFWLARHVLIPRKWASFMLFPDAGPRDVWGTVPGHPDPVRLPDDFHRNESEAWSLFDRPGEESR